MTQARRAVSSILTRSGSSTEARRPTEWPLRSPRAAVEFSRHRDEAQSAETVLIELDEAGLDQVDGLLIPVVHLGDMPPAYDPPTLGHATRVAARRAAPSKATYLAPAIGLEPITCRLTGWRSSTRPGSSPSASLRTPPSGLRPPRASGCGRRGSGCFSAQ